MVNVLRVPNSKPLGGSKIDSVFHSFDIDQVGTKTVVVKSKLFAPSGFVALIQFNPIHKKYQWSVLKTVRVKVLKNGPSKICWRQPLKKCEMIWSALADFWSFKIFNDIFHKLYLVHSWIPWFIFGFSKNKIIQRLLQNPVKHLRWRFLHFCKRLRLRCLAGFSMCFCNILFL